MTAVVNLCAFKQSSGLTIDTGYTSRENLTKGVLVNIIGTSFARLPVICYWA
jgi:hypothetical protein